MILSVQNISKQFNDITILKEISFHIEDHDKCALIGINGAGKTTLLRIITGALESDSGQSVLSSGKTIGYLSQEETVDSENTIYEELLSARSDLVSMEERLRDMEQEMALRSDDALTKLMEDYEKLSHSFDLLGGHSFRSEIIGTLKGLGFDEEEMKRSISTLSGGQKTRVALTRLLITKPDLIILDEPTNHLDLNATAFLENMLINYRGAVLVVSHDRYFLDKVANKVIEIENTRSTVFQGNYSDYALKKEALRIERMNAWYKQQAVIEHEEAVIKKLREFNREKSIKRAESRVKKLNKIERLEKPAELNDAMNLSLMPKVTSGNDVISVTELSKRFDSLSLFEDLSFELKRGEHVALIGDNGTGKTTIMKILNGLLSPDSGEIRLGTNVDSAYYDQEHHVLHEDKTLFEELQDEHPDMDNTAVRNTLAAFLFTGDDVFKKISSLSGGEKGRVSLAKLMLSRANLLFLDEPTNHLDITSREILEDAINAYEGTVLYVSHDRYFINRTASRILELSGNRLTEYLGDYDYYAEKKALLKGSPDQAHSGAAPGGSSVSSIPGSTGSGNSSGQISGGAGSARESVGALDYKAQKEAAAIKRKRENDLRKCEERISYLEEENKKTESEMTLPVNVSNSVRLQELSARINANNEELERLYELWETLA
ncbi:MAG: ABC-F family ATP-binding cassette domain-containing protein [Lachnospiraceae bacterium]|nr:ABC-F family ATP-binding cassette domain-containing protein [Lachnospiraceae bacterium]